MYNKNMRIRVLTIFPDQFESFLRHPLTARAIEKQLLDLEIIDLKEYADGSFRHIDDSPFGGGAGMILRCEPVFRALAACRTDSSRVIAFTPGGTVYNQRHARRLLKEEDLIFICGHYEGMDERILQAIDEEISVGDYILSGGELPAMTVMDSLIRMMKGTIRAESTAEESFEDGLLEYPQYTKPRSFEGMDVPEVLLSGHAEKIRLCALVGACGADYIKTSTGFSKGGATFEDIALMAAHVPAGLRIKAAGGISSLEDARRFLELGADRLGTSRIVKLAKGMETEHGY